MESVTQEEDPIRLVVLDFHETLVSNKQLSVSMSEFNSTGYLTKAMPDYAWVKAFLVYLHEAGIKIGVASFQEDRFDGMTHEEIVRKRNGEDIKQKLDVVIGGRRLILGVLDKVFAGDVEARRAVVPDENIVLFDDMPSGLLMEPATKALQVGRLSEGMSIKPQQAILFDDNKANIYAASQAGYRTGTVGFSHLLGRRYWQWATNPNNFENDVIFLHNQLVKTTGHNLTLPVSSPATQMLVLGTFISDLSLSDLSELADISDSLAIENDDDTLMFVRPIKAMMETRVSLACNTDVYHDSLLTLGTALFNWSRAAAVQAKNASDPKCSATKTPVFLTDQIQDLKEYALRRSPHSRELTTALDKMEMTRLSFIDAVCKVPSSGIVADNQAVIYKRHQFVSSCETVGELL